jgi:DNA-binding CsgD family transcriptional regulator
LHFPIVGLASLLLNEAAGALCKSCGPRLWGNTIAMQDLTKRQAQVQRLVEEKLSAEAIAVKLGMTVGTVNAHKTRIRRRLAGRSLTKREQEVIKLIGSGLSDAEISVTLGISHRTVETHRQSVIAKYKARSTPHLLVMLNEEAIKGLHARISELETLVAELEKKVGRTEDKLGRG